MAITITNDAVSTRTNLGLGDAATKTTGTGAGNVPLNSNLSTVAASGAYADVSGTPTFKTVGGTSIEGSGNIESLPIGGSPGQVVTNTSSGVGTWADAAGGGKVLQVVQVGITANSSGTSTLHTSAVSSWTSLISKTINLSSSSSKVLVQFAMSMGEGGGGSESLHLVRGGTEIGHADADGDRNRSFTTSDGWGRTNYDLRTVPGIYLDSPGASGNTTYEVKHTRYDTTAYYFNRTKNHRTSAAGYDGVASSYLILTEIEG